MQTNFSENRMKDPDIARSNGILRSCVHCGFCIATCPTYQVLGDELDSPRGRIYLIKQMLESGRPADEKTVLHLDRCLSCLACMTTCPSDVHYMHLVDHARDHVERTYRRPFFDRVLRRVLLEILPYPARFRIVLRFGRMFRAFARLMPDARLRAMLRMIPARIPPESALDAPQTFPAAGQRRFRVALATGCAQRVLNTDINEATIRLLRRLGCEVAISEGAGCCGALAHHMGKVAEGREAACGNVRAWSRELQSGLGAIIVNASGCGTMIKDYGHVLRDSDMAEDAARVSGKAMDITEFLSRAEFPECEPRDLLVGYHAACSLQHGQKVRSEPKELLAKAGFRVAEPADSHLCCGSAGTYNILQPQIAAELGARKVRSLEEIAPDVIATGNIGCLMQIGSATRIPVVHTVELLDWATGGPVPNAVRALDAGKRH